MEELTLFHTEYFKPTATIITLIAHLNTNDYIIYLPTLVEWHL
jgi:hypothetical protein